MNRRNQVLVVDFGLALGAMALGVLATPRLSAGVGLLTAIGFSVVVAVLVLLEHTDALALIDDRRPASLLVVAAATLGVALALILGRLVVPWPSGPMLAGLGAGLAGYRTAFGLYRPVPAARLAHADLDWR